MGMCRGCKNLTILWLRVERGRFYIFRGSFVIKGARKISWVHEHLKSILKIWQILCGNELLIFGDCSVKVYLNFHERRRP